MDIAPDILGVVGHTPLVRLSRFGRDTRAQIVAKLEMLNPGGSVKDRIGLLMIEDAERRGLLRPGGTIVEPTSGNTGVGLAMAAAIKGYRLVCTMADKQSQEKRDLLRAYGAEVVVCPTSVAPESPESYYKVAERLAKELPGGFLPNQYYNPQNPEAHYRTTGPEIWEQTEGRITHFISGLGTSGTFVGVARRLKEFNPEIRAISMQPDSPLHGLEGLKHMATAMVPGIYDPGLADENVEVSTEDAQQIVQRLAEEEGLFVGTSSGANVLAALRLARTLARNAVVVTILCDRGERYVD